jgi:hypothetical protein
MFPSCPRRGGDAFDWFFLATAHWELADRAEAPESSDTAAEWMAKNAPQRRAAAFP